MELTGLSTDVNFPHMRILMYLVYTWQVATQMVASFGYSAPEFALSGIYTTKSDVYSFGVVMLELLTGRKPLDRYDISCNFMDVIFAIYTFLASLLGTKTKGICSSVPV